MTTMAEVRRIALGLLAAAIITAPVASADPDQDKLFIAKLIFSGLMPSAGTSQQQWEATAIDAAHHVCSAMAAPGETKHDIEHSMVRQGADPDTAQALVDAAVEVYCPQYRLD